MRVARVVSSGGVSLAYREVVGASVGGAAVLLHHPLGASSVFWTEVLHRLAESGVHAVAYDARGHGSSDEGDCSWASQMDDAEAVARAAFGAGRRFAFVGCSMGCLVALQLAVRQPHLVTCLVLSSLLVNNTPAAPVLCERAALVAQRGMAAVADSTVARWFGPAASEAVKERTRAELLACRPAAYAAHIAAIAATDLSALLPSVAVPSVVVVVGALDAGVPPATAVETAKGLRAALLQWPDVAHALPAERPEQFARLILEALPADLK